MTCEQGRRLPLPRHSATRDIGAVGEAAGEVIGTWRGEMCSRRPSPVFRLWNMRSETLGFVCLVICACLFVYFLFFFYVLMHVSLYVFCLFCYLCVFFLLFTYACVVYIFLFIWLYFLCMFGYFLVYSFYYLCIIYACFLFIYIYLFIYAQIQHRYITAFSFNLANTPLSLISPFCVRPCPSVHIFILPLHPSLPKIANKK